MARIKTRAQAAPARQRLFVDGGVLARMVETCVRAAVAEEFDAHIGAGPYERTPERTTWRNGTKPRTMRTAVGALRFDVPQARDGSFRPSAFERYQRSDRALVAALQEMVVQGVSTRRVSAVLEQMAGFEVSAATASRAMAELDEEIARWRQRRLDGQEWPHLIIDARFEKVRVQGRVVSQAVLIVAGISDEGRRELLGLWLGDSESEATWSEAFADLKRRGVQGVEMIVSDAHGGIRAAMARHFQGVAWQRCRVHLMREMLAKVSWRDHRELAKDLRAIYTSESAVVCERVAAEVADKWQARAPKMAECLRAGVGDTLVAKALGPRLWHRLCSTNMLERLMRTIRARTRVAGIFPNGAACERLVGALVIEIDEAWASERGCYIRLDEG